MRKFVRICRLSVVGMAILAAPGQNCKKILTVVDVIRGAQKLDGRIVCIRGVILPTIGVLPDAPLFQDLAPTDGWRQPTSSRRERLGLLDWSSGMGVDEDLYKPDSFELLSAASRKSGAKPGELAFDVTVRAAVMYKKNLSEQAGLAVPPPLKPLVKSFAHHDVELILLEILKVNAVHRIGSIETPSVQKKASDERGW